MKIITGMHRSGTSVIARFFYEAGADMGSPETFYPGNKWNPGGYFEQKDILDVNIPLIQSLWGKFSYLKLPSEETILRRSRKISGKISAAAQKYRNKVVKEPRFCLTLKAWQDCGSEFSKILVCLREPVQSAHSLWTRNRFPISYGLGLWHEHYSRLLDHPGNASLWFVDYNSLLDKTLYDRELKAAFDFLDCPAEESRRRELWEKIIEVKMNHHPVHSVSYPAKVKKLWQELLERHRQQFGNIF